MYAFMYITYSFHGCLKFGKERNGKLFTYDSNQTKFISFFLDIKNQLISNSLLHV